MSRTQKTTVAQTSSVQQPLTPKPSHIEQLSWEYLMPKRKERAAGYPRCSDENLYDSPTLDSQAKAIRAHCQKEGYEITDDHMYPEAMTVYLLPYTQRPKLMELLAAAKRREFDVLVVTEVRAISRRQVEVFVIYDMLQKYGVRIETIQEKFEDSAIGRFILATRAMVAELERENTYMRCQRGKRDRLEAGNLNGHAHPTYGYVFVDTDKEVKARYDFNTKVIYVDATGEEWTEIKVVRYIFDLASGGNFTAYTSTTIRYAILDALPMENTIRLSHDLSWRNRTDERVEALRALQPLSLDAAHGEEDCAFSDLLAAPPFVLPDPAEEEEKRHQAKRAQVEALLARLTPREQQVLRLCYGLDDADGRAHAPTDVARQLDLDCSTVCNLEKQALQKLRSPQDTEAEKACHPQTHRRSTPPRPPQEQSQRLEVACTELVAQGAPISVRSLARLTHLDKKVIQPFLRLYWERQGTEQERLTSACAALEAEGAPVTMAGLCSRAHIGSKPAAAFSKDYHPAVRPKQRPVVVKQATHVSKETPQERLRQAFARLLAQGEKVTRARLRQEAGVSTDAAGAFLRAQRAGDASPDLPSIERGNRQP